MKEPSTGRVKRLFAHRKVEGLCLWCSAKTENGLQLCGECRRKENMQHSQRRKDLRQRAKAAGVCRKCGKPPVGESCLCEKHYFQQVAHANLGSTRFALALKDKFETQQSKCYYTGRDLTLGVNAQVDHLLSVKNHPDMKADISNIVWRLTEINLMKNGMDKDSFLQTCRFIAERWQG